MKRSHITVGHQASTATTRLHAGCGVSYPWSPGTLVIANVMDEFADTSKATRRRKESSP